MTERNVLVVDWSANSKPKTGADSIWIGDAYGNRVNPSTRVEAIEFLKKLILHKGNEKKKWLIAFDFSFGVPCKDGREDGGCPVPWWRESTNVQDEPADHWHSEFWEKVCDGFPKPSSFDDNNKGAELRWRVANELNKDFQKELFWGCPEKRQHDLAFLSSKKGDRGEIEYEKRKTDEEIVGAKSPWQLLGNGSVGSQMLMGICHLQRWRKDEEWSDKISVWPFEESHKRIVFAETFPSHPNFVDLIEKIHTRCCGLVKDAVQVTAVARSLQEVLDESETQLFDLSDLSKSDREIASIEGKILPSKNTRSECDKSDDQIDELILGQDQDNWTRLLGSASEKIKNPSEQCPPKRTTPD